MPYCYYCGSKNTDEAKYCAHCGKPIGAPVASNERKQVYDGVLHKCPNCGELLNSFITICPTCGYEIRGAKSSQSVELLAKKLEELTASKHETTRERFWREEFTNAHHKTDEQKIELIKNFNIPTTREDVLEFITYAIGNIDTEVLSDSIYKTRTERAISEAWIVKLDQAYSKATVLFGNDPTFAPVVQLYQQKKEDIREAIRIKEKKEQDLLKPKFPWGLLICFGFSQCVVAVVAD